MNEYMDDNNIYLSFDIRNFPADLLSVFLIFLIIYIVILSIYKVFCIIEKAKKLHYYEL